MRLFLIRNKKYIMAEKIPQEGVYLCDEGGYPVEYFYWRTDINGNGVIQKGSCKSRGDFVCVLEWLTRTGNILTHIWDYDYTAYGFCGYPKNSRNDIIKEFGARIKELYYIKARCCGAKVTEAQLQYMERLAVKEAKEHPGLAEYILSETSRQDNYLRQLLMESFPVSAPRSYVAAPHICVPNDYVPNATLHSGRHHADAYGSRY